MISGLPLPLRARPVSDVTMFGMRYVRLSKGVRVRLIRLYIEDVGSATAARLLGINRKTVVAWCRELRRRLTVIVPTLPPVENSVGFRGYHIRRIAKCNGLFQRARQYHLLESRLRYQLRRDFKTTVLEVSRDLLE